MARTMPQNKEAEMSVLGLCFLDNSLIGKILEEVNGDMFYNDANKKIYEAIKKMYENNIALDITTITEELDKSKDLAAVGGIEYLTDVIDSVVTASNIDYYINIIKEKAIIRRLINTATDIITESYNEEENITSLLDNAEKSILEVIRSRQTTEFRPINEILKNAQAQLEFLSQNKSTISGLETGFYDLDKATSGLHEGEMIVLAARPGMGKTAFALNIATHAAKTTKKAIAIFNLEMSAEQLVNRMISAIGGIDGRKLQNGQLNQNDWKKYNEAISQLANTNIYVEDNASITSNDIRAKCRRLATKSEGLGLIIIDYLQLLTTGGKRPESRQQEVSDISRSIKTMAMELKVPVIALAQLSRNAEKRENNEPMLADLRESGSIEQDADIVMFINRKDYYKAKTELGKNENVETDIIIAKHRKGGTGKFTVLFEPTMMNFRNYMVMEKEGEY